MFLDLNTLFHSMLCTLILFITSMVRYFVYLFNTSGGGTRQELNGIKKLCTVREQYYPINSLTIVDIFMEDWYLFGDSEYSPQLRVICFIVIRLLYLSRIGGPLLEIMFQRISLVWSILYCFTRNRGIN